jgi:dephospho-CoA kinase
VSRGNQPGGARPEREPGARRRALGPRRDLLVGITGGIAAGKSTVAQMLGRLGAPVVDADALARDVTSPGGGEPGGVEGVGEGAKPREGRTGASCAQVLAQLVEAFGAQILDSTGELDRAKLGRLVFDDPEARRRLEGITHPAIMAAAEAQIAALRRAGHRVVLYEAALLVETGLHRRMDLLLVVTAGEETRVERLMARSGMSRDDAERRLRAQAPERDKVAVADIVIDNTGTLEETRAQVLRAWREIVRRGAG